MENQEKSSHDSEKAWQERKEREYQEAVAATESLYQMSLSEDQDEARIKQYCDAIWRHFGSFQDGLIEKERGQFFETLPILNKVARVYENFGSGENYSIRSKVRELSSEARYVLSQGFQHADEETLAQLDGPKAQDFFESLKLLITSEYDFAIEKSVNFLQRHKNLFERLSEEKQQPELLQKAEELEAFLTTREFEEALVDAIQRGIEARKSPRKMKADIAYCRDLLKEVLGRYGFDPEEIISVWQSSHTAHGGPEPQIRRNMDKVFRLEDQREGIARFLYKEFGIRNFERYPESILLAQYDEFEDVEKPYGVLLEATSDYNGAFSAWHQTEIWEKLFEHIKEEYAFRIAEAKSKRDIARQLIRLKRKYGDHHKISFAFIGGHGNEDSIVFGGPI